MFDMRTQLAGNTTVQKLIDFGRQLLPSTSSGLQEFDTGTVKPFGTILALHGELISLGFQLHQNKPFGPANPNQPPGGRQMFYVLDTTWLDSGKPVLDGILVRIKTMGNARMPRKRIPHMS